MTLMTRLTSVDFGFALKAAAVGIAFSLTTLPQTASARDTFVSHGVQFDREWFEDNKDSYNYTPLNQANRLDADVQILLRKVKAFKIKDSYCLPPDQPQKTPDRQKLDQMWNLLQGFEREYYGLVHLAVMARASSQADTYQVQANYILRPIIWPHFLPMVESILDMRKALREAPELDCSKKNQESAMRMRTTNSEMLAALNGARQSNPHTQRREVALPGQTGNGLDMLSRANQGSSDARTNPGRTTTATNRQPSNQNSSTNRTANQPTNQPVMRETGDATGIFSPTSRTETPITRETGDSTGIFNRNSRLDTPIMREAGTDTGIFNRNSRVDTPIMRETGTDTGIFSQNGQREPLQPTSRALSFPTSKSGAFSSRVGSSVELAGERETMTEPNY